MSKEQKAKLIDEIEGIISKSTVGIITDYRGLPTSELKNLRNKLSESGIRYKVVKNTLARIAAERAGRNQLGGLFEGPVALAFSAGEIAEPAKILIEYIRGTKSTLAIKGGFIADRLLTPADVTTLSILPPRETLLAQVFAGLQSPMVSLVNVLSNPLRGMMGILQARIKQLEGK